MEVGKAFREIQAEVLGGWLELRQGGELERFCQEVCGWRVEEGMVRVPTNKENEARGEVREERVGVDQFARVFRRAFEQPA